MAEAAAPAAAGLQEWNGQQVPAIVATACRTPFRGQSGLGARSLRVLAYFDEKVVLEAPRKSPFETLRAEDLTTDNIYTYFTLKRDPARRPVKAQFGDINPSRLSNEIFDSPRIPDAEKLELCGILKTQCSRAWKAQYDSRSSAPAPADVDLEAGGEDVLLCGAEKRAKSRQQTLDSLRFQNLTAGAITAINYMLSLFFFVCRIPFSIIEHWAFKKFLKALSPAYVKSLFKRNALSRTHLDEVYKDTVETTDALLEKIPGKETIIVDGFKDRNGRHVINISKAKPGFASYFRTSWFGRKTHKGATYAAEVEKCITPKTLAVCADNTSTNTGQIKGMFGILKRKFSGLFFIGCCVHTMDLLCEGWAKIDQLVTTIKKVKDIIQFVRRYSILHEEFRFLQKQRHLVNSSASMKGLREFPDTRFAYAYLMIVMCWDNWSVFLELVESEAYKTLKKQKGKRSAAAFQSFEDCLSASFKRELRDAKAVLSYASVTLHELEGDKQLSSIVVPAYCIFFYCISRINEEPDMTLSAQTRTEIINEVKMRWIGDGSKIGLRHDVHCLAFELDVYLHYLIFHALGRDMFIAIKQSYKEESVMNALETYCGGSQHDTYLEALAELKGRQGAFAIMCKLVDKKAERVVNDLKKDPSFVSTSPVQQFFRLVEEGKALETTLKYYQAICNDLSKDAHARKFANMAVEVLSIITHACQVERINKNHGMVHSKARAALSNSNTSKFLSIFTNQELQRKYETPAPRIYTYNGLLSQVSIGDADDDDVLSRIIHLDVTEYLPAERLDEESSEDEEMEETENDVLTFDSFQVPSSFTLITEAAFLSADVVAAGGFYVLQYWGTSTWNLGVIKKYKPNARVYNFDVNWEGDAVRSQQPKLDMYYHGTSDPEPGNWVYLKKDAHVNAAHPRPVEATTDAPPAQRART